MKRKPIYKLELLLISSGLIVVSYLIGILVPDSINASPTVVYQQGMVQIFSGVMGIVGSGVFFVWFIKCSKHQRQIAKDQRTCTQ